MTMILIYPFIGLTFACIVIIACMCKPIFVESIQPQIKQHGATKLAFIVLLICVAFWPFIIVDMIKTCRKGR